VVRYIEELSLRVRSLLVKKRDWDATFKKPGLDELSPAGIGVIKDIGNYCGAYRSTVQKTMSGSIDPLAMAYAEGQRSVYLFVQKRLRLTDEQILKLTEQAHD
jgi:hypothetical protein